jgi:hypothetical protein
MQAGSLRRLVLLAVLSCSTGLASQTAGKTPAKANPSKSYCHPVYAFCFKYPSSWGMLGDVFGGAGVVVAPPQKQERELWDSVTVALVVAPPKENEEPTTIGEAIAQAVSGVRRSGQNFETVERQHRSVNGNPAELVKLHYIENSGGREWTEELVFIQGPDSEIYSVALKSAPASLPRMDPAFARIVDSWNLPDAASTPDTTDGAAGAKPKPAKPASTKPSNPPKP